LTNCRSSNSPVFGGRAPAASTTAPTAERMKMRRTSSQAVTMTTTPGSRRTRAMTTAGAIGKLADSPRLRASTASDHRSPTSPISAMMSGVGTTRFTTSFSRITVPAATGATSTLKGNPSKATATADSTLNRQDARRCRRCAS
jgi:hypothetical protein